MLQRKTLHNPYQINIIFHITINCSTFYSVVFAESNRFREFTGEFRT